MKIIQSRQWVFYENRTHGNDRAAGGAQAAPRRPHSVDVRAVSDRAEKCLAGR